MVKRFCDGCRRELSGDDLAVNSPKYFTLKTQHSAPYLDIKVSVVAQGYDLCLSCLKQVIDGRWTGGPNAKGHPTNGMG